MTCILAVSKIWNPHLEANLEKRTSKKFITVTSVQELTEKFSELNPDYIFFPHWSFMIPPEIYKHTECIVFHMTDLPFGRGGSPLQNLIANEIYETKLTALRCEKELDAGPVYLKKPLSLKGNAQEIYQHATVLIEDMIVEILRDKLIPVPQVGEVVTFARRKPSDGNLGTLDKLHKIYDYIRMLDADNYPKAFLETDDFKFEFTQAILHDDEVTATVTIKLKKEKVCQ